jgi:hypothetical protein
MLGLLIEGFSRLAIIADSGLTIRQITLHEF